MSPWGGVPSEDKTVELEGASLYGVGTVVDVLHKRALRHYKRGLQEYIHLHSKDPESARRAWLGLRAIVASSESDELVKAPGIRAHLYRLARAQLAAGAGLSPRPAPNFSHNTTTLRALRRDLTAAQSEVLELRYARELRPEEIACVLEIDVGEVMDMLLLASNQALSHLGAGELRAGLLRCYSVDLEVISGHADDESEHPPLPPGTLIASRYRLVARVGSGAFGDVYRAEDADVPGHVVALKLLHQPAHNVDAKERALRELRHIASVFHPSVVQFKDHGWHERRLWFVMPWYAGETLESRMQGAPLSRADAHSIFLPIARALEAMHSAGLRHQDVKPDNIFLAELPNEDLLPVLIDLGVAASDAEILIAGTPTYFAPEVAALFAQTSKAKLVTEKADVFSLALALRNALEPELEAVVEAGALEAFVEGRATTPLELPKRREHRFLKSSFRRWLSADPERRPTAAEFAQELSILIRPEQKRLARRKRMRVLLPVVFLAGAAFTTAIQHYETRQLRTGAQLSEAHANLENAFEAQAASERREALMALSFEELQARAQEQAQELALGEEALAVLQTRLTSAHQAQEEIQRALSRAEVELTEERAALELSETTHAAELAQSQDELRVAQEQATTDATRFAAERSELEQSVSRLSREAEAAELALVEARAETAASEERVESLVRALEDEIRQRRTLRSQLESQRRRGAEQSGGTSGTAGASAEIDDDVAPTEPNRLESPNANSDSSE